mmetsp:Transcript_42384/g.76077  ORF Transcript_42384/g.76077 Transcript_42384/m.76077 type:complete len:1072 (-) Transcript_42384:142-3357(-)|eukprot:CAMPEP_0197660756 /NCGR_PEP_ID=MMETSP1338-20131121/51044_1 /TAXON_ID=43686 ORGANISM="Pelagodinium beii, Strain RCC1491" /NCGR_SAMPLE_ID=MMETSP1338 /ASSEMBLY_ACC=CAM_ASM_000754 /LENGTH=1071 /DNA_ID=CAMNT_0043238181 /DNA_START=48 /DNA_END=3263 /DNA_ORIENTATION=-
MTASNPSSPSSSKNSSNKSDEVKKAEERLYKRLLKEKEARHEERKRAQRLQGNDPDRKRKQDRAEAARDDFSDSGSGSEDSEDSPARSPGRSPKQLSKDAPSSRSASSSASRLRHAGNDDKFGTKDSIEEDSNEDEDESEEEERSTKSSAMDEDGSEEEDESDEASDSEEEAMQMARNANRPRGSVLLSAKSRGSVAPGERVKGQATGLSVEAPNLKKKKKKTASAQENFDSAAGWISQQGKMAGLLMGIAPNKKQKKWMRRSWKKLKAKLADMKAKVTGKEEEDNDEEEAGDGGDHSVKMIKAFALGLPMPEGGESGDEDAASGYGSDDSEVDRMKENAMRKSQAQFARQMTAQQLENLHIRARESLGIPDEEDEYSRWLRMERRCGILQFRMKIAIKRITVEENPPSPGLKSFVNSFKFELFIGAMISFNAVITGMDAMYATGEARPAIISIMENVFVFVFVVEYFLRLKADTWVWMFQPMNMFDTFTVWITGVLVVWIMEPLGIEINLLRRTAALRVLRLGRIAKAVRTIPTFHELWMLVSGVLECTRLLFWSAVIVGAVHFMFAVTVMEVVTKSPEFRNDELVQKIFGDLWYSMFTLFQIMTFDSWAGIVRHIMKTMPEAAAIFFAFMGIAGIVLFNLMTAVVVKNASDAAEQDEEAKAQQQVALQAKMQADLKEMFAALDEDGSGTLSREEFTDVLDDVLFVRQMKVLDIDLDELPDIFDILDDGDGAITTDEFCIGLTRLQGVAMSREMLKCTSKNKMLNVSFDMVTDTMNVKVDRTLGAIEGCMESSHENLVELQQMTAEVLKKLEEVGIQRTVRSTAEGMEELPPPTLEMVAEKEENESREADFKKQLALMAKQQGKPPPVEEPVAAPKSESYKRIPASFVINKKTEKEARQKATRQKKALENKVKAMSMDAEEELPLPGVPLEFMDTWLGLEVSPKRKAPAERIAAIKAAQTKYGQAAEKEKAEKAAKGIVEKQLPGVLPPILAPIGSVDGIMAKKPEEKPPEEAEEEKQDLKKLSVKELKVICAELEIEVVKGMKKAELISLIEERRVEIENEGKTPQTLM